MRWLSLLVAAALIGGAAFDAHAERRVALVIGNSAYTGIAPLKNPAHDAALMTSTLQQLGFEVTTLVDADQRTMKQAMLDFGRTLRAGTDASLFYYAGHGVQANGENYLIPTDAEVKDEGELDLQAIKVNDFLRVLEASPSKVNIVVLDACRNNPFAGSVRAATRGLAMVDAPRGTYIAYSTSPNAVAEDGDEGSPYTLALADAMMVAGERLEDTFKRARRSVLAATGDQQVPWETSSITGDFFFRPAAEAAVAAAEPSADANQRSGPILDQETTFWTSIVDSTNAADFEAYLAQFPEGVFAPLARIRLAALTEPAAAAVEPPPSEAVEEQQVAALDPAEQAPAAVDPLVLARDLQGELARVGCYADRIDGIWGRRSRAALEAFAHERDAAFESYDPSLAALDLVKAVTERVCAPVVRQPTVTRTADEPRSTRPARARAEAAPRVRCVRNNVQDPRPNRPEFVIWGTNTACTP